MNVYVESLRNLTWLEGYVSSLSETSGLCRDQFVKPPKTLRWYNMFSDKKDFSYSKVHIWTNKLARLNSSFPRLANCSLPTAPTFRPVSQDTWKKWEQAAYDQNYMCNQVASFSGCLTKVHNSMVTQLKLIQGDNSKEKSSNKLHQASEELEILGYI